MQPDYNQVGKYSNVPCAMRAQLEYFRCAIVSCLCCFGGVVQPDYSAVVANGIRVMSGKGKKKTIWAGILRQNVDNPS